MASDITTSVELIAVLAVYCAAFCPILCWAVGREVSPESEQNRKANSLG